MAEWNRAFGEGPGIIVIRGGYADLEVIDEASAILAQIIRDEDAAGTSSGDHFAAAGANSRVWNAHEKLCMRDPEVYARYNANDLLRMAAESWLGTAYQLTAQVNLVRPGGKAQTAHRDYHMGFQTVEQLARYPASQHRLSASLTLQGAIAHCDMPVASGPTKLLPYSQSYLPGYLAVHRPEFRACFEANYVQLPLEKGDLLFFNPATFHAAGDNLTTDIQRFANLLQIGSAYGRSIEIVDRARISKAVFGPLKAMRAAGALSAREVENVVAATAEGYAFPANLDIDSPLGGMAPPSQQDVMRQALAEDWDAAAFEAALDAQDRPQALALSGRPRRARREGGALPPRAAPVRGRRGVRRAGGARLRRGYRAPLAPPAAIPDDRRRTRGRDMRKFLILLDDTPEMLNAMRYAAIRASKTGGGGRDARASSIPRSSSTSSGVADVMRAEAREKIEAHFQIFKDRMERREGITPTLAVREGDKVEAIIAAHQGRPRDRRPGARRRRRQGRSRAGGRGADRAAHDRDGRADHHRARAR